MCAYGQNIVIRVKQREFVNWSLSLCWVMVRSCYRSNWRCMRGAITFDFAIPIMNLLGSNYRRLLSEVLIRAKPTNQGTSCWGTSGGSFEAVLRQSILHNVARLGASGKSGIRCIQTVRTMRETIKDCGSYELFLESWLQASLTQLV